MPKFRNIPRVVEADQWQPGKEIPNVRHIGTPGKSIAFVIDARGQRHELVRGDWVVQEGADRAYPIAASKFETLYEPVEEKKKGGEKK